MARKKAAYDDARPASDVYTGLLAISLLAMIASCVMLWLDYSQYPSQKAPAPPAIPTGGPKSAQATPAEPGLLQLAAPTPSAASIQPASAIEAPALPSPIIPAVLEQPATPAAPTAIVIPTLPPLPQ